MLPTLFNAIDVAAPTAAEHRAEPIGEVLRERLEHLVPVIPAIADLLTTALAAYIATRDAGIVVAAAFGMAAFLALRVETSRRLRPRLSRDAGPVATRLGLVGVVMSAFIGSSSLAVTAVAVVLVLAGRSLAYLAVGALRQRGIGVERAVIVGAGEVAQELARSLRRRPEEGVEPLGFVDRFDGEYDDLPLPALGDVDELTRVFRIHNVDRAVLAYGRTRDAEMVPLLRRLQRLGVEVHAVPRYFELGSDLGLAGTDEIWGIPLVPLHRPARRRGSYRAKRLLDLVLGSLLLVAFAPVLAILAVLVRRSSPGPILFRQERVTQDGRTFEVLKFRTMRPSADSDVEWAADEHRITRIGHLLRKTHLDELPQLVNVVRGDMSLVGPRPERPHFVDRFSHEHDAYGERHRLPAGLTGLAQVNGLWGDTSIEDRVRFDNRYIETWSPWQDLVILARTVRTVLGHQAVEEEEPVADEVEATTETPAPDPRVLVTGELPRLRTEPAA